MQSANLIYYRQNIYSQFGEGGIIEEICKRLKLTRGWFVEFGAWDGKHLSNTYRLLKDASWRGVYIEGDKLRYEVLLQTCSGFSGRTFPLCAMVGYEGENKLDDLLAQTPIPQDFDLLSVDIDSYDWQVWNALKNYHPKIVIVESNASIPPSTSSIHNPPISYGASFTALVNLGLEKGYQIVCHTGNCIFVRKDLVLQLGLPADLISQPEILFNYRRHYKEKFLNWLRQVLPSKLLHKLFYLADLPRKMRRKRTSIP